MFHSSFVTNTYIQKKKILQVNSGDDYQLVGAANAAIGHSHSGGGPAFTMKELGAIILGAILPAILASSHSH